MSWPSPLMFCTRSVTTSALVTPVSCAVMLLPLKEIAPTVAVPLRTQPPQM